MEIVDVTKVDIKTKNHIYIGRGTVFGNPFRMYDESDRQRVVDEFEQYLRYKLSILDPVTITSMLTLNEQNVLMCHCAPRACHGDIIKKYWTMLFQDGKWLAKKLVTLKPTMCYAGIGSRQTPEEILDMMSIIAKGLEDKGYILRSGGADGADTAFAQDVNRKEVYLPWKGFNGSSSELFHTTQEAAVIAKLIHPSYSKLSASAQSLMARNSCQVLGMSLKNPSDFIVCYTDDGCESDKTRTPATGGTGQAIHLASLWGIPIYNLKNKESQDKVFALLKE